MLSPPQFPCHPRVHEPVAEDLVRHSGIPQKDVARTLTQILAGHEAAETSSSTGQGCGRAENPDSEHTGRRDVAPSLCRAEAAPRYQVTQTSIRTLRTRALRVYSSDANELSRDAAAHHHSHSRPSATGSSLLGVLIVFGPNRFCSGCELAAYSTVTLLARLRG